MVAVWSATAGQSSFVNTAGHFCKKYGLCRSILWLITSTVTFCRCGENVYKLGRLHNVGLQCRFFYFVIFQIGTSMFFNSLSVIALFLSPTITQFLNFPCLSFSCHLFLSPSPVACVLLSPCLQYTAPPFEHCFWVLAVRHVCSNC